MAKAPCPVCHKASIKEFKPFCSKRCQDDDLSKWLTGVYTVPVVEDDDIPDDIASPEDD